MWLVGGAVLIFLYRRGTLKIPDAVLPTATSHTSVPPQVVELHHKIVAPVEAAPPPDTVQVVELNVPMEIRLTPKPPKP